MPSRSGPPKRLSALLSSLVGEYGHSDKLTEARVSNAWADIAGPDVISVTDAVWMKDTVLHVRILSPSWRNELFLRREDIREQINEVVGEEVVSAIVFR